MKKLLLTAIAILGASAAYSQVGIGTRTPNNSSQLEVTVDGQPEKRGILIPRVALQSTNSMNPIVNTGTLPNSLLVFNTAETGTAPFGVTPGFYYWYENKWIKMISNGDDTNTTNVSLTQNGQDLILTDSDGNNVRIALSDLQKITTLVNNNDGTYTYTNEAGTQVTIDVPADVVSNFNDIITNTSVLNQLITNLTNTSVGGNVYYDGTSFTYVDNTGTSHTINIQDIVRGNETVTTLVNNNDGTYTYTNEAGTQVTIDVPADVVSNFNDIITNTSVLNQLITNLTNTSVGGNVYYDGTSFTYVDNTGTSHTINIQDIVRGNETVTTLVDNNNGTYTYKSEDGTVTTIDVPADVIQNFQDIMNDNSVSTIVKNIIDANETLTILGYDPATKKLSYKDENGNTTLLDMSQLVTGNETVTTLVDNNNGTYTYTSEDGTVTTIDVPADVIQNFQDIMNDNSVSTIVKNIIDANETLTILGYDSATKKLSYKDEDGNTTILDMSQLVTGNETVTTLVDNNNGTYTYTSEDGTVTTIDVPADVIQNFQDIMNDNSVSTIVKNIIDANETLTILGYDSATKKLSYKDENGNTTLLDMSQLVTGNETVTTLVDNNDGTYTYTNEAGTQVTIDVPADVVSNFNDIITNTSVLNQLITNLTNTSVGGNVYYDGTSFTYVDNTGTSHTINIQDIVRGNETVTTLVDNNNGTYTYTSEDGTVTTIDVPADVIQNFQDIMNDNSVSTIVKNIIDANETLTILGYDSATKKLSYKDENGNTTLLDMSQLVTGNETVTTLVNNNDGTYTYTNEAGTQVTIDVPADVVSNFNDIITNTSVLNQLITNLTNTSVGGNVYYDGTSFTYVDNTGTSHTINIQDIVRGNETVTTLVDNNNGTYTYTSEDGTVTTIDVPADVIQNFQDIMNDNSVSTIVKNIIDANETLTILGYDSATKKLSYKDENGNTTLLDMSQLVTGNETVTTLVNNNDGTYTYTSEDGTVTTIDVPADVIQNFQDIMNDNSVSTIVKNIIDANETLTILGYDSATKKLSYKDENGNTTLLDMSQLVTGNETVTTLVDNNNGTYTYTSENGTVTTIDVPADVIQNFQDIMNDNSVSTIVKNIIDANETLTILGYDSATKKLSYKDENGNTTLLDMSQLVTGNETVTTLVDNNNGTYTYTSENGTVTTIDVPADVIQNFQDIMNDNSVSTIVKNIIDANETLTILGYDSATKKLSYKDENGNTTLLDMSQLVTGNETVTTLVNNNDGTYTYTNEAGTQVTIDVPADVVSNFNDIITNTSVLNQLITNLTNTSVGGNVYYDGTSFTYVDNTGTSHTINIQDIVQANQKIVTLSNGTNTTVASTSAGNTTDYKVNVNPATTTTTGAVKAGAGLDVAADGTLTVNVNTIPNATDKTATVAAGTNTTVAVNNANPNNPVYTVNVPTASGAALGVVKEASTAPTINIGADGALSVNTTALQNNQKTSSVVAGTATTVTSATSGNNTAYTVNVSPATASVTGAVKPGTGLSVAADGTLSVNTSASGIGNTFSSTDLDITNGSGATLTAVTANIKDGAVTSAKILDGTIVNADIAGSTITAGKLANAGNNQVLTTNATGVPTWVNQSALVPATTNTLVNNGTNTLTSTVNGVVATAAAVNSVTTSLSGSNLTTTVNGVGSTALNLAPVVAANDKTSSVVSGTTTTVTSATSGNNTAYTVEINPSSVQSSQKTTSVTGSGLATVTSTVSGNNTAYNVDVSAANVQSNQKLTTLSNGTNTTVASTVSGNTTDYKVSVPTASTTLGVVKQAATNPTINIAADGTLSVNTTATGLGKTLSTDGIIQVNSASSLANSVLADAALSIANNSITTGKIADDAVTVAKIANAGNNQVLTTDGTGAPTWVNQSALVPATTNTLVNNGTNTLTSTVNGAVATAAAVNSVTTTLSGSNLTTTVNGVGSTALNLAPVVAANDKTSSVLAGTATTVTSATSGNNTAYTVNVSPATASATGAVKPGTGLSVAADGTLSVNTSASGIGNTFSSTDLDITNGSGATLTAVTANIKDGAVTSAKILDGTIVNADIAGSTITAGKLANAGNNQVLTTDGTGAPTWTNQSTLITANQKNTTVSSGTYTTLAITTPNTNTTNYQVDVSPTALAGAGLKLNTVTGRIDVDINTIPNASDKTATVAAGTNTTVAVNNANPNNPVYTVNVPTASGATLGVVKEASTAPTINIGADGALSVNTTALQNNQKTSSVVAGTATTVTSATTGNNTAYTVNVSPATASATGAVKPGTGLSVAADGTLSVNTTATGLGKTLSTDGIIQVNSASTLANSVLADAALSIANNSITTGKIADDAVTVAKIANAGNNQVLTTDGTGAPTWVNQSALVPATTNTLVNNGTNTLTSTVNGVVATAAAVNTVTTTLSGSNLTTVVNGVSSTALNLAPVVAANDKTSSVVSGTTTTVTSATSGNNTAYTVEINPSSVQSNQKTASVTGSGLATVTSSVSGNNTAYNVDVSAANVQSNQKLTTLSNGTNTTVASTVSGNTTDYKVSVPTASTTLGVVKQAAANPTINIAPDGTLSVNTTATGLGKTLSTDGIIQVNSASTLANSVLADAALSIANNSITTGKIADDAVTVAKIANAGNNQVLTTDGTGAPTWVNQSALVPATTNTLVNNGTNTLTSTVNGVVATAAAVNSVTTSLSGSNLTTTVNGVGSTALNLAPVVAANDKTSSVLAGTATTVTSATSGNNTAYTVNVSPATASATGAVKPGTGLSVAADGTLSVNTSASGIGNTFSSTDLDITNGSGATLTAVTANIKDGAVTSAKILDGTIVNADIAGSTITAGKLANAGNNQVLTTNATGVPTWVNQSALVPATTNTLVNNGTNTLTSTVNGVVATAAAVNTVTTTLSGSNLTTVVNGVSSTALNLAPVVAANDKTSSVVSGTTTTVTSATSGNNTAYTVEINPSSVQSNQKTTSVTGSGLATVTSTVSGNNTAYNVDVSAANVQSNQKLTTLSNGTNTTVASTVSGNTTDYKVSVPTATASNLGVVKEASTAPTINIAADGTLSVNTTALQNNQKTSSVVAGTATTVTSATSGNNTAYTVNVSPATASATGAVKPGTGLSVAADGTLSVNTTATGLGKTLSTDGIIQVNSASSLANSVLADAALSIANNSITTGKIADDAVTVAKIANAGNNQVLTTDATGAPTWVNKNTLDNIYTTDGSLATDRIVNTNGKTLRFRATTPETRETIFDFSTGAYLTNATTTGRSNIRVSSGTSIVDLYQDSNSRSQLVSSGTSTGLVVGTANNSARPLELITNGTTRVHVSSAGKVGIGTANMLGTTNTNVLLAVNGSIETANSTYADYVFEDYFNGTSELKKDYTFKSIKEVEKFINENKHLPGITSIKDLRQNDKGEYIFNMSELSIQMLEKVEELYLHTIEQQKQLEAKDKEIDQLKENAKNMDERLKRLEKILLDQKK